MLLRCIRNALENGLTVDYITDMDPFSGFAKTKYVYIRSNTDNPAAARLFTLFSLGGEDAQGAGYDAYVNRMGCYPTRSSRDELLYNANHPFETVNSLPTNLEYVYENYVDVQDFFEYYASEFQYLSPAAKRSNPYHPYSRCGRFQPAPVFLIE